MEVDVPVNYNPYKTDPFYNIEDKNHHLIFQHLTFNDFINLSQVCYGWDPFFAPLIASRSRLKILETRDNEFHSDVLKNPVRRYEELRIRQLLRTRIHVRALLVDLAENLTTIQTVFDFEMNGVRLPRVTSLEIKTECKTAHFFQGLLSAVTGLRKLHLSGHNRFPNKVVECLLVNPALEELILENHAPHQVVNQLVHDIPARLSVLKMDDARFGLVATENLIFLLENQTDITEIKILNCSFDIFVRVFRDLLFLERLTFSQSDYYDVREDLPEHESLQEINFIDPRFSVVRRLLKLSPYVNRVYLSGAKVTMLNHIFNDTGVLDITYGYIYGRDDMNEEYEEKYSEHCRNYDKTLRQI